VFQGGVGRFSDVAEEGPDVYARPPDRQSVPEQAQELFVSHLYALVFGFRDLADGHEVLQSTMLENYAPGTAAELEGGNRVALFGRQRQSMSRLRCCQNVASHFIALRHYTGTPGF
jgi:hypothetical protein